MDFTSFHVFLQIRYGVETTYAVNPVFLNTADLMLDCWNESVDIVVNTELFLCDHGVSRERCEWFMLGVTNY